MAHLINGDCLEELRKLDDNSVDSVVTDPPYHLTSITNRFGKEGSAPAKYGTDGAFQRASKGFMGKDWDGGDIAFRPELWTECLRVLKPGGYLLAFSAAKNYHHMATAVEMAGFEIRDQIMWVYGSGFPKSHNVGKAVDKLQGNQREVIGTKNDFALDGRVRNTDNHKPLQETLNADHSYGYKDGWSTPVTQGNSDWEGWGTALKPAHEPIVMARKPFKGTVAKNVLEHGTGAINIDGCRVSSSETITTHSKKCDSDIYGDYGTLDTHQTEGQKLGRFPANFIHDGSDEVVELFPNAKGGAYPQTRGPGFFNNFEGQETPGGARQMGDNGSAARFFYCAKASKKDRNAGCENLPEQQYSYDGRDKPIENAFQRNESKASNNHPTVKPNALMRYLCRLVTQPGGVVLDPFMGSGSTGRAAIEEGFEFIGIEREPEYFSIAQARCG